MEGKPQKVKKENRKKEIDTFRLINALPISLIQYVVVVLEYGFTTQKSHI